MNKSYYIDRVHKQIIYTDQEFQHHGVLGQRWGVITRNVGVNYVPIGRGGSKNTKTETANGSYDTKHYSKKYRQSYNLGDSYLMYLYGKRQFVGDAIRKATNNYQKFRYKSPINEEGFNRDRLLTKGGFAKQVAKHIGLNAFRVALLCNGIKNLSLARQPLPDYNGGYSIDKNFNISYKRPTSDYYETLSKITKAKGDVLINTLLTGYLVGYLGLRTYDTIHKYKEYKSDNQRRENLAVDKETGLKLRKDNDDDATDLKNVNPGYRKFTGDANCPGCAVATELRARGYDVRAKDFEGIVLRSSITNAFKNAKDLSILTTDKIFSPNFYASKIGKNYECVDKTMAALSKQPNGSRGILMLEYGRGGGHVTTYRVENGKAKIYEGQLGKVLDGRTTTALLGNCYETSFFRTDNLEPNFDVCKEVVK